MRYYPLTIDSEKRVHVTVNSTLLSEGIFLVGVKQARAVNERLAPYILQRRIKGANTISMHE